MAEAAEERAVIVIVNRAGDNMHRGWSVLWRGLTIAQAKAICSDDRTAGPEHFLAWVREEDCVKWRWVEDDGRYDPILAELGISPERRKCGRGEE